MTREENIRAILDTCFSESKDEIKEVALNNIMSLSADAEEMVLHKILEKGMIELPQEYVAVVRCKECRYAHECHKSVQFTHNEPNAVTIGYTKIDFCSHGERREE